MCVIQVGPLIFGPEMWVTPRIPVRIAVDPILRDAGYEHTQLRGLSGKLSEHHLMFQNFCEALG